MYNTVCIKTGPSLIWVGILGLVILYIYALAGFAYLRDVFDPNNQVYCASLSQCFMSVIRYGLIGDYDEEVASGAREIFFMTGGQNYDGHISKRAF